MNRGITKLELTTMRLTSPRTILFKILGISYLSLFFGYDLGISSPTNNFIKILNNEINQNSNKLDETLSMNSIDFNVFEKCCAYIVPRKFTKKELKNLSDDEGLKRLLESKQKEVWKCLRNS